MELLLPAHDYSLLFGTMHILAQSFPLAGQLLVLVLPQGLQDCRHETQLQPSS